MIRNERRTWASDSASLQAAYGTAVGNDLCADNDTPALNALKALRGAPISMGRGETPVGCCQWPSGIAIFVIQTADAGIVLAAISASAV